MLISQKHKGGRRAFCFISLLTLIMMFMPLPVNAQTPETRDSLLANIKKFTDNDDFVRGEAITAIAKAGEFAVEYLIKSIKDTNEAVRVCSAIALYKIAPRGTNAIPALIAALTDKNSLVRWNSALALSKYKEKAMPAVPNLVELLKDFDHDVRWASYIALSKIDPQAIDKGPDTKEVISTLQNMVPELMRSLKVPGVSVCLISHNEIAWMESFGIANTRTGQKVNSKTMFEACSMSKPVFSFLALKLAEQGKLDLDKPLCQYLPEEFVAENEEYAKLITARMILSHTSGMPNWRNGGDETSGPLPLYFKPGSKFSYSGEGISYLQRVFEKISGQTLDKYAKENLFIPLELNSSSFVWTAGLDSQIAAGHDSAGAFNMKTRYLHANAAYSLYTTPENYAQFIIEIMSHKHPEGVSLSGSMVNEMLKHQIMSDIRPPTDRPGRALGLFSFRGLGWAIDSTITGDIVYHSGSNGSGFRCYTQFSMKTGNGIVIMTNGANGSDLWVKLISKIGDF